MALDINEKVSSIMTTNLVTLHPKDTLNEVKEIFANHAIHHIPIVEFKRIVGIVSKADLQYYERHYDNVPYGDLLEKGRLSAYAIGDVMTKGLATLSPDDSISDALELFKENIFHAIPIEVESELVGILTTHDIICALAEI